MHAERLDLLKGDRIENMDDLLGRFFPHLTGSSDEMASMGKFYQVSTFQSYFPIRPELIA